MAPNFLYCLVQELNLEISWRVIYMASFELTWSNPNIKEGVFYRTSTSGITTILSILCLYFIWLGFDYILKLFEGYCCLCIPKRDLGPIF